MEILEVCRLLGGGQHLPLLTWRVVGLRAQDKRDRCSLVFLTAKSFGGVFILGNSVGVFLRVRQRRFSFL